MVVVVVCRLLLCTQRVAGVVMLINIKVGLLMEVVMVMVMIQ